MIFFTASHLVSTHLRTYILRSTMLFISQVFSLSMPFVTVITSAYFLRQMIGYWRLLQKPDLIFTSKMFDTTALEAPRF